MMQIMPKMQQMRKDFVAQSAAKAAAAAPAAPAAAAP
jgi:hypothetical protein